MPARKGETAMDMSKRNIIILKLARTMAFSIHLAGGFTALCGGVGLAAGLDSHGENMTLWLVGGVALSIAGFWLHCRWSDAAEGMEYRWQSRNLPPRPVRRM